MNVLEVLKDKLGKQSKGSFIEVGAVLEAIERLENKSAKGKPNWVAPSGPGQCGFPCFCGKGELLMKVTVGMMKYTGEYARYRECNRCGKRFLTKEVVSKEMPDGDGRKAESGKRKAEMVGGAA